MKIGPDSRTLLFEVFHVEFECSSGLDYPVLLILVIERRSNFEPPFSSVLGFTRMGQIQIKRSFQVSKLE